MIEEKTWSEFRNSGLLWWVNRTLHLFGWALVVELEEDKITRVYPARCKFRGFSEEIETEGFARLTQYLKENIDTLDNCLKKSDKASDE